MSVRVYFDSGLTQHGNPGGNNFFLVEGNRVYFLTEGGVPCIFVQQNVPMHPALKGHVIKATYQKRIDDIDHVAMIEAGEYVHGTFRAEVTRTLDGSKGRGFVMWINAAAPTVAMLNRYIRPLLAGENKPTRAYSKKTA